MHDKKLIAQILKLHFERGRTLSSLSEEYGISRKTLSSAKARYIETAEMDKQAAIQLAAMEENRKLKEENEELKKEVEFLKKAAAFFAKNQK